MNKKFVFQYEMRGNNMGERSKATVSGVFRSKEDLVEIINYLEEKGVSENDISVLMSKETQNKHFTIDTSTKAPDEAFKGLATGSLFGAVIGGLTLVGVVALPGYGLSISGPVVGLITGAAAGGLVGTIIGALIGLGIPEHEAKFFEKVVKEKGNVLIAANIDKDIKSDVKKQFNKYGAFHIATQ